MEDHLVAEMLMSLAGGDSWSFATPLGATGKPAPTLLPLMADVERVCVKRDESDQVFAEILHTTLEPGFLANHWADVGWSLTDRRTTSDGLEFWRCTQSERVVQVWACPPDNESRRIVFLVRGNP